MNLPGYYPDEHRALHPAASLLRDELIVRTSGSTSGRACRVSRSTGPLDIVSSNPATAAHSKHSITFTCIGRNMSAANRLKRYQGIANTNVQLFPDGAPGSMGASRLPPRAAH